MNAVLALALQQAKNLEMIARKKREEEIAAQKEAEDLSDIEFFKSHEVSGIVKNTLKNYLENMTVKGLEDLADSYNHKTSLSSCHRIRLNFEFSDFVDDYTPDFENNKTAIRRGEKAVFMYLPDVYDMDSGRVNDGFIVEFRFFETERGKTLKSS